MIGESQNSGSESMRYLKTHIEEFYPKSKYLRDIWLTIKEKSNFRPLYYDDSVFIGEVVLGKRNGVGVLIYKTNRVYEGEWLDDMRHGKGYEQYTNGNIYIGEYFKGRAEGKGKYLWVNNECYEGEWYQGRKHGFGVWKGASGESYVGQWQNNEANGFGVQISQLGDKYEGEWKASKKHGKGTEQFYTGDIYIGNYKRGLPHGFGKYIWADQSYYEGNFENGLKEGQGKWIKPIAKIDKKTGTKTIHTYEYYGQFQNDKKEGYGTFKWPTNSIYEGHFKNDKRHGFGIMKWNDKTEYQGEWQRGVQHGRGKILLASGLLKEGYFENNVLVKEEQSSKQQTIEYSDSINPTKQSKYMTVVHESLQDCSFEELVKIKYSQKYSKRRRIQSTINHSMVESRLQTVRQDLRFDNIKSAQSNRKNAENFLSQRKLSRSPSPAWKPSGKYNSRLF